MQKVMSCQPLHALHIGRNLSSGCRNRPLLKLTILQEFSRLAVGHAWLWSERVKMSVNAVGAKAAILLRYIRLSSPTCTFLGVSALSVTMQQYAILIMVRNPRSTSIQKS
jgi:hypothetical protein